MELVTERENANLRVLCDPTEESDFSNAVPFEAATETWPVATSRIIYDAYQTLRTQKVRV